MGNRKNRNPDPPAREPDEEFDSWDGSGRCPKCQGHDCDPEGGCIHDE